MRRHRVLLSIAAAVVLAVAGTGVVLVTAVAPAGPSATHRPQAASSGPPTTAAPFGDPRRADPCSLFDVASLERFGQTDVVGDLNAAGSCQAQITTSAGADVLVLATFANPSSHPPLGTREEVGVLTIHREPASDGTCYRTISVPDGSRVYLSANTPAGSPAVDLCAIVDDATATAAAVVAGGDVGRRSGEDPPNALTNIDTCPLLDPAVLREVSGLDADRREPGFAGWSCRWGGDPAYEYAPFVVISVRRAKPFTSPPTEIAGRSVVVTPARDEDGAICSMEIVHRSYTGESGNARVEVLNLTVYAGDQQTSDGACRLATGLVAAIAPKLPPASRPA